MSARIDCRGSGGTLELGRPATGFDQGLGVATKDSDRLEADDWEGSAHALGVKSGERVPCPYMVMFDTSLKKLVPRVPYIWRDVPTFLS